MFGYRIDIEHPAWLSLLVAIPLIWWLSYRSLSGLGRWRRWFALGLRSLIIVLLILALAELQVVRSSQRAAVIYVLDQSLSVPPTQRAAMVDYVDQEILKHRNRDTKDLAGVVVFGGDPAVEVPPFADDVHIPRVESLVDREHTNLSAALKLAQASFPEDASKRVVIISDGNENLGNGIEQARAMSQAGIGIDVLPVRYLPQAEVAVEKITIPPDVNRSQPFELKVVLNNLSTPELPNGGVSRGKLKITRKTQDGDVVLAEQDVKLEPGKRVFSIREQVDASNFYTYEARFIPNTAADDALPQNNIATAYTHVRGHGQVLLIEDAENAGEFKFLIERLREKEEFEITVQSSNDLFTSLPQLQAFDTVILANVPRDQFSDEQIKMLVRNTQQMGAGLIMLGGRNSFGAGGWTNTELEAAMPVDFQVKSAKVKAIGALAMLMHASELSTGNYWQKVIAKNSINALGNEDYCGVVQWDGTNNVHWLWSEGGMPLIKVGGNRETKMLRRIDQMNPGDMPDFDAPMISASVAFSKLADAAVKHMIIISDGDPSAPKSSTIASLKAQRVVVSTVEVGTHGQAGSQGNTLTAIANQTGGKYYAVKDAKALPKIYQQEVRKIARPLVFEKPDGFTPQIAYPHPITQTIDSLPPITGFVLTQKKDNPLVEVAIVSPVPSDEATRTILATWTYGLGKTAVMTTDAGARWATQWTQWENYDRLYSQLVRWSMRPTAEQGKFTISTELHDGKVRAVITALDKEDDFLNFLEMNAAVVGPDMKPSDLKIRQTAPGRYIGEFDAPDSGNYFLTISPGEKMMPIRTGVNVPYSPEFLDREPNESLLRTLVELKPRDGQPGKWIEAKSPGRSRMEQLLETDTFRHDLPPAGSSQPTWHILLLIAGCLFFGDVFVRRVAVNFAFVAVAAGKLRNKLLNRQQEVKTEYLERLRSRKREVGQQVDQMRAATRFEPTPDAPPPLPDALDRELQSSSAPPKKPPARPGTTGPESEEEDYTSRLLKAKKKAQDEREQK